LDSSVPICDIEYDFGPVVTAVFDLGSQANGKLYPIVGEFVKVLFCHKSLFIDGTHGTQISDIPAEFEKGKNVQVGSN
jgi:hypothetical protein